MLSRYDLIHFKFCYYDVTIDKHEIKSKWCLIKSLSAK